MRPRRAWIGAALAITLAGCQSAAPAGSQGGPQPSATSPISSATPVASPSQPLQSPPGGITAFDGTVTWVADALNSGGGSSNEFHKSMTVTVHLVIKDGGPGFVDAGSTYEYAGTTAQDDAQTESSCGLHAESTGTGGGPFSVPGGLMLGSYSPSVPQLSLTIHAPYDSTGSMTFLCNGQESTDTATVVETLSCGDPAGSRLVGTMTDRIADMTCAEPWAIGQGGVTVSGTLTGS